MKLDGKFPPYGKFPPCFAPSSDLTSWSDGAAGENFDCLVQFSIDFALENAISMSKIPKIFACGAFWYSFSIDFALEIAISMPQIVKNFALRAPTLHLNYTELQLLRMVWKWKRNEHKNTKNYENSRRRRKFLASKGPKL